MTILEEAEIMCEQCLETQRLLLHISILSSVQHNLCFHSILGSSLFKKNDNSKCVL